MTGQKPTTGARTTWAYVYELVPPLPEDRLRTIKALLEREHMDAKNAARVWGSRLVLQQQVTHILVVSDSPQQDLAANRRMEGELRDLEAGFSITAPMPVADEPVAPLDRS